MPLSSGDILGGHYRSEAEIGRGAYGRVYRARDTKLDRPVAIKELARGVDELGSSAFSDYVRRFEREARVQAGFNHPNIVHVYELIQEGADRLYLVMELVDGESLRDLLARRGPLPADEAIRVTADILAGLAVVHADPRDIVHRDIKPSNVLLTTSGQAKLSDFGLAQVGDESMRSGAGQAHPGTAFYMSPEQSSTSDYLYPASDLFGVGCVLFEMLTGVPYKRAQRERKTLQVLRPDAPPWLGEIMTAALAKDPDDRPKDAAEMGRLLARARAKVEAETRTIAETEERERQETQRKAEAEAERARLAEQERRQRAAAEQARIAGELQALAEAQRKSAEESQRRIRTEEAERARQEAARRAQSEADATRREKREQDRRAADERARQEAEAHAAASRRTILWLVVTIGIVTLVYGLWWLWQPREGKRIMFGEAYAVTPPYISTETATPQPASPGHTPTLTASPRPVPVSQGTPYAKPIIAISPNNAARMVELARWGRGKSNCIALSPNGDQLVAATPLGIYIYNSLTFEDKLYIDQAAEKVAFSADGGFLASSSNTTVTLWDITTGEKIREISDTADAINDLIFSPDGSLFVTGSATKIALWDTTTWSPVATLMDSDHKRVFRGEITFSNDSRKLASGSGAYVAIWDRDRNWDQTTVGPHGQVPTDEQVRAGTAVSDFVKSTSFSPDQRYLVSGSTDNTIAVWELATGKQTASLRHWGSVDIISFSPNGKLVAAAGFASLSLWDAETFDLIRADENESGEQISFSPDGTMYSSTMWGHVKAWDFPSGQMLRELPGHEGRATSIAFSPDGTNVGSVLGSRVSLFDVTTGATTRDFSYPYYVYDLDLGVYPASLIVVLQEKAIQVNLASGQQVREITGGESVDITRDRSSLAIGTWNNVEIWDMSTWKKTCSTNLTGHQRVAFSPDGTILAARGSSEASVAILNATNCAVITQLPSKGWAMAFSPDQQLLATSWTGVQVWSTADWHLIRTIDMGTYQGDNMIAFSSDGRVMAVGAQGAVMLVEPSSGTILARVTGDHLGGVNTVSFSPDDRLLAAGTEEGTIHVWGIVP